MQNHKELGWGCTISCEKDIVYITSRSSSCPPDILLKETIILYHVYLEQFSKLGRVKISPKTLPQNFWLNFTYSTAAIAPFYFFKHTKVRLFLFLSLGLSLTQRFPQNNILLPYYSFSRLFKMELLVMQVCVFWADC